jgi:hypothetical protein
MVSSPSIPVEKMIFRASPVVAVMLLTRRLVVAAVRLDVSSIVAVPVDGVVALIGYASPVVNPEPI